MVLDLEDVSDVYEQFTDEDYPEFDAFIDTRDNSNIVLINVEVPREVSDSIDYYNETKRSYDSPPTTP